MGETVAKKLAFSFGSIEALIEASYESLIAVDEIGDRIAQSVLSFFSDPEQREIVLRLKAHGLQMALDVQTTAQMSDTLKGFNFVISGVFERHSRPELKTLIEKNGGKVVGSLSSKTHYLLAGDQMGPAKKEKALRLEVPMITESDFEEMINA